MEATESYNSSEIARPEFIDISDSEEARDLIREDMLKGRLPILTVPKKFAHVIKQGLVPHSTWIGQPFLAGTLHREPYLPDGEERIVLQIKVSPDRVEPRFTGPDKHYHGVVIFKGPISPEEIEEMGNIETIH